MKEVSFLLAVAISVAAAAVCPSGAFYDKNYKKCFLISDEESDFFDAEDSCLSLGGHLVTIDKRFFNWYISDLASELGIDKFWVGANKILSLEWGWTSRKEFNRRHWAHEHREVLDRCVAVDHGEWKVEDCTSRLPFVCEFQADNTPIELFWEKIFGISVGVKTTTEKDSTSATREKGSGKKSPGNLRPNTLNSTFLPQSTSMKTINATFILQPSLPKATNVTVLSQPTTSEISDSQSEEGKIIINVDAKEGTKISTTAQPTTEQTTTVTDEITTVTSTTTPTVSTSTIAMTTKTVPTSTTTASTTRITTPSTTRTTTPQTITTTTKRTTTTSQTTTTPSTTTAEPTTESTTTTTPSTTTAEPSTESTTTTTTPKTLTTTTQTRATSTVTQPLVRNITREVTMKCNGGWVHFEKWCYKVHKEKVSWLESTKMCSKESANLVSIYSQEENNFLSGLVRDDVWLGLFEVSGEWVWIGNNVVTPPAVEKSFENWIEGEKPFDNKHGCAKMLSKKKGIWQDITSEKCSNVLDSPYNLAGFVCKRDAIPLNSTGKKNDFYSFVKKVKEERKDLDVDIPE